jgi:hypothetical protein
MMPDISMCTKKDCPSFDHCYRAQAKPNEPQAYNSFDNGDKDKCDNYKEFYLEMPKFLRRGDD